ncbi:MAG: GNAT family N-acetyltransferase [Candidatus Acidiferrales bacterium]
MRRMLTGRCQVREEGPEDRPLVRRVNEAAFGRADEADLVERLRGENAVLVSLVAEIDSAIVGYVLFGRMWIEAASGSISAVALAPVAVVPSHQRSGIGSAMIRRGLELLRERREEIVIVLGHADYYPRFGFSCKSARHLQSSFPPEYYMAMELKPGALARARGKVRYPAAFDL